MYKGPHNCIPRYCSRIVCVMIAVYRAANGHTAPFGQRRSRIVSPRPRSVSFLFCGVLTLLFLSMSTLLRAEDPPPNPSSSSAVGESVTNPATGEVTTVTALIVDPVGTPTAGNTAFVVTADGYAILVKAVGEIIYNNDSPPLGFTIMSQNTVAQTVQLCASPPSGPTASLAYQGTYANLQNQFGTTPAPPVVTPPVVVTGAGGVSRVYTGDGGDNGRDGALLYRLRREGMAPPALLSITRTAQQFRQQTG